MKTATVMFLKVLKKFASSKSVPQTAVSAYLEEYSFLYLKSTSHLSMPNLADKIVKMKRHRVEVHVSNGSSSSEESGSSSSEEEERKRICKHQEAHKEQKKMKSGRKNEGQKKLNFP